MSRNPAALGATDANHAEIVAAYEAEYCLVHDTHTLGGGFPDLTVRIQTKRGMVVSLVEVKTLDGRLRPSQERFIREWGSCVAVVCTSGDVRTHVQSVREKFR